MTKIEIELPLEVVELFGTEDRVKERCVRYFNKILESQTTKTIDQKIDEHLETQYRTLVYVANCDYTRAARSSFETFKAGLPSKCYNAVKSYITGRTRSFPRIVYDYANEKYTTYYKPLNKKNHYALKSRHEFKTYDMPLITFNLRREITGVYDNVDDYTLNNGKSTPRWFSFISDEPTMAFIRDKEDYKKYKKYPFASKEAKEQFKKIKKEI